LAIASARLKALPTKFRSVRIPTTTACVKINMDDPTSIEIRGPFETRYLAFLETITHLRPRLHRYCSRMIGSVIDGEDIVQDALLQAYRKLDTFDDNRALTPWLYQFCKAEKKGLTAIGRWHLLMSAHRRGRKHGLLLLKPFELDRGI
jgi:hypothetical protein